MSCVAQFAQDYGPFITAGAIFVSGLIAAIAVIHNLRAARRRATIDLVMHERVNQRLLDARRKVLTLHHGNAEFTKFALKEHGETDEAMALLTVLNFQEFVASGIREKAFDEEIYKRVWFSVVVRDWDAFEGFIRELRKTRNRPTLFQEFQWLAERWKKAPLEKDA